MWQLALCYGISDVSNEVCTAFWEIVAKQWFPKAGNDQSAPYEPLDVNGQWFAPSLLHFVFRRFQIIIMCSLFVNTDVDTGNRDASVRFVCASANLER